MQTNPALAVRSTFLHEATNTAGIASLMTIPKIGRQIFLFHGFPLAVASRSAQNGDCVEKGSQNRHVFSSLFPFCE